MKASSICLFYNAPLSVQQLHAGLCCPLSGDWNLFGFRFSSESDLTVNSDQIKLLFIEVS